MLWRWNELLERKNGYFCKEGLIRNMKFTENCYEKVIEWIKEADKIIVGFGAEWSVPSVETLFHAQEQWEASLELQKTYPAKCVEEDTEMFQEKDGKALDRIDKIQEGYQIVRKLLKEKDYFLITTNIDAFLYQQGFLKERIVAPCGDIRKLQCEEMEHPVWEFCEKENLPICPICGRTGKLNVMQNAPYHESGYLEAWNTYQSWLQHTMNKKIVLLELGEGFQTPTVMRWPFEKLVFFQEKAILCCVHKSLSMVSEEICKRAYSVAEDSVDFVIQLGKKEKERGWT